MISGFIDQLRFGAPHRWPGCWVLAIAALLWASPSLSQDGEADYSGLDVEAETRGRTAVAKTVVGRSPRTSVELFALPYKLWDGDALGTGLSLELAIPGWQGIRLGIAGHRTLSQNRDYYLTDFYVGAYSKFFFHSALYRYGLSPFATAGLGFYRVDGEAIDSRRHEDKLIDSTSLALSGGLHYQYNKRFAGYGEYQLHSGEGSLNTLQLGLSVWLF